MYKGDFRAGIDGGVYLNQDGSGYSFTVTGSHIEATNYFTQTITTIDEVDATWFFEESLVNKNGPSNWIVIPFNKDDFKSYVLMNDSSIEDEKLKPEFAAKYFRKDFDTANGIYKLNIYFDNNNPNA